MSLSFLAPLYDALHLPDFHERVQVSPGLSLAARPVALAALATTTNRPVLVVAARQDTADRLLATLATLLPGDRQPVPWLSPDPLPYEQLPHDPDLSSLRVAVLDRLQRADSATPPVIVTTVRALMSYIRAPESFRRDVIDFEVGGRVDDRGLMARLVRAGYRVEPLADLAGTVSRRGGIIDIVPPGRSDGVRIELFGDEIDSIRSYDPATQRSTERLRSARILPPVEFDVDAAMDAGDLAARLDLSPLRPEVHDEWVELLDRLDAGAVPDAIDLLAPAFDGNRSTLIDHLPDNAIARASRNPLLAGVYAQINKVRLHAQWDVMKEQILNPDVIRAYNAQHRGIYQALDRRDAQLAQARILEHLEKARDDLLRANSG